MTSSASKRVELNVRIGKDRGDVDHELRSAGEEGLNAHTLDRWLVGNEGSPDQAAKQLKKHASWAQTEKPKLVGKKDVQDGLRGTNVSLQGCDAYGQPLIVVDLARMERQHQHESGLSSPHIQGLLVAAVDAAVQSMDGRNNMEGKMSVLVDLQGASHKSFDRILLQEVFALLKVHYPERLREVWMWDAPFYFAAVWQTVSPFINQGTREKIRFVRGKRGQHTLVTRFGETVLPKKYGGRADLVPVSQAVERAGVPSNGEATYPAPQMLPGQATLLHSSNNNGKSCELDDPGVNHASSKTGDGPPASSDVVAGDSLKLPSRKPSAANGGRLPCSPSTQIPQVVDVSVPRWSDSIETRAGDLDGGPTQKLGKGPDQDRDRSTGSASSGVLPPSSLSDPGWQRAKLPPTSPLCMPWAGDGQAGVRAGEYHVVASSGTPRDASREVDGLQDATVSPACVDGGGRWESTGHRARGSSRKGSVTEVATNGGRRGTSARSFNEERGAGGGSAAASTQFGSPKHGSHVGHVPQNVPKVDDVNDPPLTIKRGRRFPPKVPSGPVFGAAAVIRFPVKKGAATVRVCWCCLCPKTRS
eukprot:jgi/Botrbrau1/14108/Bobra.182_3s0051.1